tara:strand:- start:728 stop:1177 length:450 start_codon:yes stop_codon:yes gene_type:complete
MVLSPKINEEQNKIDEFVIVEDDDKVNKNRFFNCCGRINKRKQDEEINNNIQKLKKYKKDKIDEQTNTEVNNKELNKETNEKIDDNDLNKDNEKEEVLNKAEEGCTDCGAGCSKVCNCIEFFIVRWFNSFTDCCKSCFGCSDKKNKKDK